MKNFFKHPATIITAIIAALIAGGFIGKSDWFKNLFASKPGNTGDTPPADGTACKMPDDSDGVYKNGVCVKKIDILPDQNVETRINSQKSGTNAPATIQVWFGAPVPYTYMGCTYGKPYYMIFQGRRVKILTKLSCP